MFQAQGKNGFGDVQKLVEQNGWSMHRVQNNSRKFIVMSSNETRVFNWINPIQSLYDTLLQKSFDEFIKTYTTIMNQDGTITVAKREKKEKKVGAKSKIALELNEKITDVTLKVMSMSLIRGSEEHLALREQLHNLTKQLSDLGLTRQSGTGELTSEELREIRKRGEEKKRERKQKLSTKVSRKTTIIKEEA